MGKMGLWNFFAADRTIRPYSPPTAILTKETLQSFLERYKTVYLKPDTGMREEGIFKALHTDSGYTLIKGETNQLTFHTLNSLYHEISKTKKLYIVQKSIDVPKLNDGIIDIR